MNDIKCVKNSEKTGELIGFFVAGYPDTESFLDIISESGKCGIDIFEIGFPSFNPYADGEVIKNAHAAVNAGVSKDIEYWRRIRKATNKPIWVMAYKKDFIEPQIYKDFAKEGLIDALITPDCTQEERKRISEELCHFGIRVLGFVNPDMKIEEWKDCFENFKYVYTQLYSGPTGMYVDSPQYQELLEFLLNYKEVQSFAGFGIKTPEMAQTLIEKGFAGVIIGTAMVERLNSSSEELYKFITEMKRVIKGG